MSNSRPSLFKRFEHTACFGHRGVPYEYQENTLSGFKRAAELGIDGVELDVLMTKDKKLVVFHDKNTRRLTGESLKVSESTWQQLKQLDILDEYSVSNLCNIPFKYAKKEKISLLEDVLEELKGQLIVNIEIKAYGFDPRQRPTGRAVAELIHKMDLYQDVFVTSFNPFPLWSLEQARPGIESGLTYAPGYAGVGKWGHRVMESNVFGKYLGSTLTNMCIANMFDDDTVELFQKRNMAIGAWTLFSQDTSWFMSKEPWNETKDYEAIKQLVNRNIDYLITDDPVKLTSLLQNPKGSSKIMTEESKKTAA